MAKIYISLFLLLLFLQLSLNKQFFAYEVKEVQVCNTYLSKDCESFKANQRFYFDFDKRLSNKPSVMMVDYHNDFRSEFVITEIDSAYNMTTIRAYKESTKTKVYFELFKDLDFFSFHQSGADEHYLFYIDKKK